MPTFAFEEAVFTNDHIQSEETESDASSIEESLSGIPNV